MADTIVRISNAGAVGLVSDLPFHQLPPEAWTEGQNVRFRDGMVEKFQGHDDVFGTPTIAPYWLLPVATPDAYYWIYPGLAKVYVYDGTNHVNITRQTAAVDVDYSATALFGWNGGSLNGIVVLNNSFDPPQMWTPSVSNKLSALKWDSGDTWASKGYHADVIRPFKDWLIALGFDDGVDYDPTLLRWSASADPGTIPDTWDEADFTYDAGYRPLAETSEPLVDCLGLGNLNLVYKQNMVYGMQWIGGQEIFRVDPLFREFGLLTRRCVKQFFGRHIVWSAGDIVMHDGVQAQSIITRKMRRWLFSNIDADNYSTCFMVPNYPSDELWFCFPEVGESLPNLALVWNWTDNTFGVRALPAVSHIAFGAVDPGATGADWDSDSESWDADTDTWGSQSYNPTLRRLLMAKPAGPKLLLADYTEQFSESDFTSFIIRKGMPYVGSDQRGAPIADLSQRKRITRVWPRMTLEGGGTINVYVGAQERIGAAVSWSEAFPFDPLSENFVDCIDSPEGPLTAIRFESTGNISWKLHGYDFELSVTGASE